MLSDCFKFHHGWSFKLADAFPMKLAMDKCMDKQKQYFFENGYMEEDWESVSLPHTFNDKDLFAARARDAGASQKRTVAFYRNYLEVPSQFKGYKVLFEAEGMRQTCYLYVNGSLVGYYEAGTAPFGFDITKYIDYDSKNLIAIATDNTCTREIPFCIAETPNKPGVVPGSYLASQDEKVDPAYEGVGFFWNCNDFNPTVGGITRPIKIHFKPKTYLTLPVYSNFQTKGTYVYAKDFDLANRSLRVAVEAEVRNETDNTVEMYIDVCIKKAGVGSVCKFSSDVNKIKGSGEVETLPTITPEDAYVKEVLEDGRIHYIPQNDESKVAPTATASVKTSVIKALSDTVNLDLWDINNPNLYTVEVTLYVNGEAVDKTEIETGFRKVDYSSEKGLMINGEPVWLRGYAQRATNEWAAIGIAPQWIKDYDAELIRKSNANHIRWMHVAGSPADVRSYDRYGVVCTQPAGDKERENFGRQWDQRVELMRDVIIAFRNHPSILFWEAGNNSINKEHMHEMRLLKEELDLNGGRFMGCRTLNTADVIDESEYVGTMLNRHAADYTAKHGPITETEYLREEAPRRVWDDFSPPDFDYRNKWIGRGGRKRVGFDFYDLTAEDLALATVGGYNEFFNDRIGGASGHNYYSACAALCWTDSAQHGRQSFSENGRMSGRVDAARNRKQSFEVFRVIQSEKPAVKIMGHWNYPALEGDNYKYNVKRFNGEFWEDTGETAFRDAKNKTIFVIASYCIKEVKLFVNDKPVGEFVEHKNMFLHTFKGVDITQHGKITAKAYDYNGVLVAEDELVTATEPKEIRLTTYTAPSGMIADGVDVAFIDIEVLDKSGNICPLCYDKIDFTLEGCGVFLGGYNSGKFDFEDIHESVIHKNYVFAECGTNRVFVRSTKKAGDIKVSAKMGEIYASCSFKSNQTIIEPLISCNDVRWSFDKDALADKVYITPIEEADKKKYIPEDKLYTKILIDGQEPDTCGVRSVNKNGAIWGAVMFILNRLKADRKGDFEFAYDEVKKILTIKSGNNIVEAEAGRTHLIVNGKENLMDGEPYVNDRGVFVMEVSAIVSYIKGVSSWYDEMMQVFRIETNR